MKARPACLLVLFLALAAAQALLTFPTRLPLRLLEACFPSAGQSGYPYAVIGDETRSAFSSNPNVLTYWGFHQGFERFVEVDAYRRAHNDDVARMVDLALADLDRVRDRPFFFSLHVNQVNAPSVPPPPISPPWGCRGRSL